MRKALIAILVGATALTPLSAQAQDSDQRERALERYERVGQRNQERFEQRQQRQQARQERRAVETRRESVREAPPVSSRQARERWEPAIDREAQRNDVRAERHDRRASDGEPRPGSISEGWQGDPNDRRMERHRQRYERLGRENQREWRRDQLREAEREARRDRQWDRAWRYDRRYDWQGWRYSNRHLFRLPPYYAPYRGHRYSRFRIGLSLGQPFYHRRYWINDPWRYRLPYAGPGYAWVRYYDDVLLVDTWSGQVVDVIYDFFW
ncbi:MAG: RcnB family protein [Pseudomonadota bacterium]|nr:RcnB family protein [Pseudomonadota bacterium]